MNQHAKVIKTIMTNMLRMNQGVQAGGVLLRGDPGIGKTTIVEMMSAMLGIKSIIIEVPHITEEHLINIPFLVYNPENNSTQSMTSKEAPTPEDGGGHEEYKMVLAQSNLYTQITQVKTMNDAQYIEHIKNAPAYIQEAYKQFGGTEDQIPTIIRQVRAKFSCILFLDEFYRQTSMRIRNILRGILNKRIGMHQLPKDTYVVYASNMRDAGLDQIPSNHQFQSVEFKAATSKEWFTWFIQKYQNKPEVELNKGVILKFAKLLKDEHISYEDMAREVRTSPRRWEQLLLYINSALPAENEQDARSLLTNVKNNFINYLSKEYSDLAEPVLKAVQELIVETSNMQVSDTNEEHDWRETLDHQIKMQKRLGEHKRHIPVISGDPGIGKTTAAWQVAKNNDLRLIDIDVSEIYADDASGLPVPGGSARDGNMSIRFSAPKLYQQIMKQIQEADQRYHDQLVQKFGEEEGEAKFKEYEGRRYKYLILFDEINRVDEKTFNALRKVILEKNFGPKGDNSGEYLKLPKEAIVIAAMNPVTGGSDVAELTSHFRDVIDIIPAKAKWSSTKQFLEGRNIQSVINDTEIDKSFKDAGLHLIDMFVEKFKTKKKEVPLEQRPFLLDLGTEVYISPREYNDLYVQLVQELDYAFSELSGKEPIEQVKRVADDQITDAFEQNLLHPMTKAGIDNDDFIQTLKMWIRQLPIKMYGGLLTKTTQGQGLSKIMSKWMDRTDFHTMPDDLDMVNAHNDINKSQVIEQMGHMMREKIVDDKSLSKYVTGPEHPKVEFVNNDIKMTGEPVPQLTNFVLAMLYSLKINGFDNDRLITIGKAVSQNARDIIAFLHRTNKISADQAQDAQREIVGLRSDIMEFTDSLQTEYKDNK